MTDPSRPSLGDAVDGRVKRKLEARRHPASDVWLGVGMMGIIGWSVVVPTLLGAAVGLWLDADHPGRISWTLALLMAGLTIGCLTAWHWVSREDKAMHEQETPHDE